LIYVDIEFNIIEEKLRLGLAPEIMHEQVVVPITQALLAQAAGKVQASFREEVYYHASNPTGEINTPRQITDARAFMTELAMPNKRMLALAPGDQSAMSATLGTYFNSEMNSPANTYGLMAKNALGFEVWEESAVSNFAAGTVSGLSDLTVNTVISDGDTNISVASGSLSGKTLKVGDVIQITDTANNLTTPGYFWVNLISKQRVNPSKFPVSFVVAVDNTGSNANYNTVTKTYMANSGNMTVSVSRQILTNPTNTGTLQNFNYISGENTVNNADFTTTFQIAAGTTLSTMNARTSNMCIADGGISIGSPPLPSLAAAEFHNTKINNINIFAARQGNIEHLTNRNVIGMMFAVKALPEYCVSLNSNT